MRILIDMNLSPEWVPYLQRMSIESLHWSTAGLATAPDSQIFDYAVANGWAIFTHDLDFGAILAARNTAAPSVIQLRSQEVLPAAIGGLVVRAIRASESYLERGALITVEPAQHRIRLLPLRDT